MLRKTFFLATSLLLATAFSAAPALAGGVAGKSYRVVFIMNGDTSPSDLCFRFLGNSNDDSGDFEIYDEEIGGRWKHLGKVNGQTLFKIRFDAEGAKFRLQGLRENDGPGGSIGMAGFATNDVTTINLSVAGYKVASCSGPPSGPEDLVAEIREVRELVEVMTAE